MLRIFKAIYFLYDSKEEKTLQIWTVKNQNFEQKTLQNFYFMKNLDEIWQKCGSYYLLFEIVIISHTPFSIIVPDGINLHKLRHIFNRF